MSRRVVITGLGVAAPNGVGIAAFSHALKNGISGIRHDKQLEELQFSCQIAGRPEISEELKSKYFTELELRGFNSTGILYGVIAGMEAWENAGLPIENNEEPDWDSGTIFGSGTSGIDKFRESIYKIDELQTRRLGSTVVAQTMNSGISAYLGGKLGLGNQVTTNSSACATGTEAIIMAYERIQSGQAKRILAGSTSDSGPYIWAGFDALRVCSSKFNDKPEQGSRPMSVTAAGFVPASGAGALVIEDLESALERGVEIYAEILGGNVNSGGQRGNGSMTAPNSSAVQQCIKKAIQNSGISADDIDAINGHLTATAKDSLEIENWTKALNRKGTDFPYINSLKSMTGHCLSAAGSIESIAAVLQLYEGFVFGNTNCEDLHPEISAHINSSKIPLQTIDCKPNIIAKASFGFGDVNACVIFKKFQK
ncbi:beta-ketoacyl-[acyl-carrier-protein] synthase family protein [Flavobacterium johnsoniae]|uniref:3-oxoacyl-[acyl-carrier-protein] synthase 1 n=1 Tax=Flavobacterium johnsoniae (strain ATCC 17061 / DSM 2064 / JCM 8514 / BCRC 14874 / CCUG 350202 / NBRC 14942 / NCIMB 11054 / UW101) TaxID=376686 RepID=A5FDA4_FLAJ1|nr:beta-ketoacyl-[acyl-carrier-protein] synthase family protein [Flavobacterium johnsoniae]ABQ06821.1 beta-ketoacyl synthase [Flavobacterium johnsoniae UW101]OXE97314.1 beta-ketoacyl-ACP synthase [Flavobacterium johnsoniae UW101]WQG81346.1 beta-ketoacyl-[acyl-carrier-protein] synthase family protein [Flavobacterium johnsoniae UW101]SHL39609.1 3-oxoacyl-(acyl-carrier-protein) synthase [Flavobacterium johnsoniae]